MTFLSLHKHLIVPKLERQNLPLLYPCICVQELLPECPEIQPKKNPCKKILCKLGIVRFFCWWSTRLEHLLHQVEANPRLGLVLSDGEVVEQIKMSHVGAVRVPVLVYEPFPLTRVCVSCANVFGLEVLQLTVDVVSVRHCLWEINCWEVKKYIIM